MNTNLFLTRPAAPSIYSMQPDSWEAVEQGIAMLKAGQIILFNLEGLSPSLAQRLTDFTSGCLCALSGHQVAIGRDVFLFCPPNVTVSLETLGDRPTVRMSDRPETRSA